MVINMTSICYAVIHIETLLVENKILLPTDWPDIANAWEVPAGYEVMQSDVARIGQYYNAANGAFEDAPVAA